MESLFNTYQELKVLKEVSENTIRDVDHLKQILRLTKTQFCHLLLYYNRLHLFFRRDLKQFTLNQDTCDEAGGRR